MTDRLERENFAEKVGRRVIIIPFHRKSVLLYHVLTEAGIEVLSFWDNDEKLQNERYKSVPITLPHKSAQLDEDVTFIIFYRKYEADIRNQLKGLGFSKFVSAQELSPTNLESYSNHISIPEMCGLIPKYSAKLWYKNSECDLPALFKEILLTVAEENAANNKSADPKTVLLVSSDLSLTGAPIALFNFSKVISERGDVPVFLAKESGSLFRTVQNEAIPVIIAPFFPFDNLLSDISSAFDLVIVNTISPHCVETVERLNGGQLPIIWWIHETSMYYKDFTPKRYYSNVHIFCAGRYARDIYMNVGVGGISIVGVLQYGIEDFFVRHEDNGGFPRKLRFMIIGTVEYRKGWDIFCEAIRKLPDDLRKKCEFYFIGKVSDYQLYGNEVLPLARDYPDNVVLIDEVSRQDLAEVIYSCDCMVCASREETGPMFITEAMMFHKVCICSENTGAAALIEDGVNGFTYANNDADLLSEKMRYVAENSVDLDDIRSKARDTYDNNYGMTVFKDNVSRILDGILGSK